MNGRHSAHRSPSPRAVGLCLTVAAVALVPSVAFAADSGPTTLRGAMGSDGAITSVQQIGAGGAVSKYDGTLPIAMKIARTTSSGRQTFTYHVENTFSRTQTVHFDDTLGAPHHTSVQLQLPLVAQLGVDVPASFKDVTAPGATVTVDSDGTRHVLWNMVLFTPLGSSVQEVSFTATGTGAPVAELRATAVDPTTTPGLSSASQSASASYQQDDFWAGYAHGGNDGLDQLFTGSGQLTDGINQAQAGAAKLHDGLASSLSGTKQAAAGSVQLYDGSKQVTSGLQQAKSGADKLLAGLGTDKQSKTIVGGLKAVSDGLASLQTAFGGDGTAANPGITFGMGCAVDVVGLVVNGNASATPDPCFASLGGSKPALPALSKVLASVPDAGIYNLLLSGVLTQALIPLNTAIGQQVAPGITQLAQGAAQLHTGLKGQFAPGLAELDAGLGKLAAGNKKVEAGLQQLSSGLVSGAKQFPAAVDGAGQIADGLVQAADGSQQIHKGIGAVKSGATGPLETQLTQASVNGHKQLAVLTAAASLAASGPGGAGATYVLSQDPHGFALAADTAGSSHTGRNVGTGLGGVVLLLAGVGSGFALGRQRRQTVA
ncbi:MAG TPA: hypothetical protein VFT62_08700 [Mycobacteriales bacterium]|nr:hypothetical protein [Mycobacteriales bacterium]